jgi:hypothetical protein
VKTKFKPFQLRFKEPLGRPECPYMFRWVLVVFGFAIRIHKWIRSDDKRHFHNHPWPFIVICLRGFYVDVSPKGRDLVKAGSIRFRSASHSHYVEVPKTGALTLLFTLPVTQNWGFWVDGKLKRPLKYFSRFNEPPCHEQ